MKTMLKQYEEERVIDNQAMKIMTGALEFRDNPISEIMCPIENTYMLDIGTSIDEHILNQIYCKGYSRIPIFQNKRDNIIGLLLTKDLLILNPKVLIVCIL